MHVDIQVSNARAIMTKQDPHFTVDPPPSPLRSRIMAAVRGKNTKPELAVRRILHAAGFRYKLHAKDLPGRPDIVLPRHGTVILVHGCFWHGHGCQRFRLPSTRAQWWDEKIKRNRRRDANVAEELVRSGWRVFLIWECALEGRGARSRETIVPMFTDWLKCGDMRGEFTSRTTSGQDNALGLTLNLPESR